MLTLLDIDKAVLRTIIYFDLFDYPLTDREVWKNLVSQHAHSPKATQLALKKLTDNKKLSCLEGFYYLPKKDNLIETRKDRYLVAKQKFNLALKNAELLRHLPGVKAIFVTNTLTYSNAKESSDIDLAIVAKSGRLWTARFFCAGLMKLLNRRPKENDKRNKICLSFYLGEASLNLEKLAYKHDMHFAFWVKQFIALYDPDQIHATFIDANRWAGQLLPNYQEYRPNDRRKIITKSKLQGWLEVVFFKQWEKLFRSWQLKILPKKLKIQAKESNSNVVIDDELLKFHDKDKRKYYNELWESHCKEYIQNFNLRNLYQIITKAFNG